MAIDETVKTRLEKAFATIGAKATVEETPPTRRVLVRHRVGQPRWQDLPQTQPPLELDVTDGKDGETFKIMLNRGRLSVLDKQAKDRHLLLLHIDGPDKAKFLCGHDERHWFVAAIPEAAPVKDVISAKLSLKPKVIQDEERRLGLKLKHRLNRQNKVAIRQGEWFFIKPRRKMDFSAATILRNEEMSRGNRSTPHIAEFACRFGGNAIWLHAKYATEGLSPEEYQKFLAHAPKHEKVGWQQRFVNAVLYVKGRITHPDHATIILDDWHRVEMNTENKARARSKMVFLD